jgi:hypothetical protein
MFTLPEESVEWAIKHVSRFYASDFFPTPFEFEAIKHAWNQIKPYLLGIDLDVYTPSTPATALAPKSNGTFRVVHNLDPLDTLLYTALIYHVSGKIEAFRIPAVQMIACSYRIEPDVGGSFFNKDGEGWRHYLEQTQNLATHFAEGSVVLLDIVDFYNQIYTHRIRNIIGEAGGTSFEPAAKAIEQFILGLNSQTSRGVPVGPAASILLAEAIMADIDRKILTLTRNFVRWVDDLRVFFLNFDDARFFLHELTTYIYENHRLVLSGEKTLILPCKQFKDRYFRDEESEKTVKIKAKAEEIALGEYYEELLQCTGPYTSPDELFDRGEYNAVLKKIQESNKFRLLSTTYAEMLTEELQSNRPDIGCLRRILRQAGRYRIRSIVEIVFAKFEELLPVVREVAIFLSKVLTENTARKYEPRLRAILGSPSTRMPYVNMWLSYIVQHDVFNATSLPDSYDQIMSLRDRALIARRRRDSTFVKTYKNKLDVLGPWDKRAIIHAARALSDDERVHWLRTIEKRGNLLEKAVASFTASSG